MSDANKPVEEEEVSQEITQGGDVIRPRRGRPKKPETAGANEVEAMYQKLIDLQEERPPAELLSEKDLNDHNRRLLRQIQIILNEDLALISAKNIARIATPNGIQKFEIAGLNKDQREHLREMFKLIVTSIKLFEDTNGNMGDAKGQLADLAKSMYKGVPGRPNK